MKCLIHSNACLTFAMLLEAYASHEFFRGLRRDGKGGLNHRRFLRRFSFEHEPDLLFTHRIGSFCLPCPRFAFTASRLVTSEGRVPTWNPLYDSCRLFNYHETHDTSFTYTSIFAWSLSPTWKHLILFHRHHLLSMIYGSSSELFGYNKKRSFI